MPGLDNDINSKLIRLLEKFDHFDPMEYGRLTEKVDKLEKTVEDLTESVKALASVAIKTEGSAVTVMWIVTRVGPWLVGLPSAAVMAQEKWHLFM